jgi:hypothetical protein
MFETSLYTLLQLLFVDLFTPRTARTAQSMLPLCWWQAQPPPAQPAAPLLLLQAAWGPDTEANFLMSCLVAGSSTHCGYSNLLMLTQLHASGTVRLTLWSPGSPVAGPGTLRHVQLPHIASIWLFASPGARPGTMQLDMCCCCNVDS